jgi:hypothetical protein
MFWTKLDLVTGVSLLTLGPCCASSSFGSINVKFPQGLGEESVDWKVVLACFAATAAADDKACSETKQITLGYSRIH